MLSIADLLHRPELGQTVKAAYQRPSLHHTPSSSLDRAEVLRNTEVHDEVHRLFRDWSLSYARLCIRRHSYDQRESTRPQVGHTGRAERPRLLVVGYPGDVSRPACQP